MTRSRDILPVRRPWTDDEIETVRINYADFPTFLIAYLINRTTCAVLGMASKLGLEKSAKFYASPWASRWNPENPRSKAHRFPKGHVPANKGLRRPGWSAGRMRETQFKKGAKPQTWVPVGTETVDAYGYRKRKVRDDAPPGMARFNWVYCHIALWEELLGPVPPGHKVVFKNGNKADIRCDNLQCLSDAAVMRRNTIHNYPDDLKQLMYLTGRVRRAANKRARHEGQDRGSAPTPVRRARRSPRSETRVQRDAHACGG